MAAAAEESTLFDCSLQSVDDEPTGRLSYESSLTANTESIVFAAKPFCVVFGCVLHELDPFARPPKPRLAVESSPSIPGSSTG
jgi:hypothetical protein